MQILAILCVTLITFIIILFAVGIHHAHQREKNLKMLLQAKKTNPKLFEQAIENVDRLETDDYFKEAKEDFDLHFEQYIEDGKA